VAFISIVLQYLILHSNGVYKPAKANSLGVKYFGERKLSIGYRNAGGLKCN